MPYFQNKTQNKGQINRSKYQKCIIYVRFWSLLLGMREVIGTVKTIQLQ